MRKTINLYGDASIRSHKTVFNITKESDLDDMWLFFEEKADKSMWADTFIMVDRMYVLTTLLMANKKMEYFDIVFEESDECFYLTIWHQGVQIPSWMLEQKHGELSLVGGIRDDEKFTMKMTLVAQNLIEGEFCPIRFDEDENTVISPEQKRLMVVYDFMEIEELEELEELNREMMEDVACISKKGFSHVNLESVILRIKRYAKICANHEQSESFASLLYELADTLYRNRQYFAKSAEDAQIELLEGTFANIMTWYRMSFKEGIEDINYLNSSMKADIGIIEVMSSSAIGAGDGGCEIKEVEFF